jgi:hypothetical protein
VLNVKVIIMCNSNLFFFFFGASSFDIKGYLYVN